ncbi:hypothetical protein DXG01_010649 [Tephrocybe rancida]|nr:hypothetical protein DXG01_010649 [Tephrocybe rancida]
MLSTSLVKLGAIACVISRHANGVHAIRITSDAGEVANKTFTYVVVGGGTAGLTVASRLAEDPATSILVIEAGPNAQNDTLVNDPGQALFAPDKYNWQYNTTAQTVGGNVLPMTQYMKAAERYHLPHPQQVKLGATVNPKAHGYSGNVNAGFPQPYEGTVMAEDMLSAARTVIPGLVKNVDVASGIPNGAARFQYSIKPGNKTEISPDGNTRSSSANAYIYPSLQEKSNLVILTSHQATRLVWGPPIGSLSQAVGVKFIQTPTPNAPTGPEFEVKILKEAIIASGAIGSPRFLELSGVGDARILTSVGIPVEVDLPAVGTNLQDQSLNLVASSVTTDIDTSDYIIVNAPFTPAVAFLDIEQVLGVSAARVAGRDLFQSIPIRAQDIVSSGAFTSLQGMEKILRTQAESIVKFKAPVIEYSFVTSFAPLAIGVSYWNLIPQWRGTVHVKSSDPTVPPEIDPRFYTGGDLDIFLKGNASRLARKIFNTHPLKELVTGELLPGLATVPENASDAQWQNFVKTTYTAVLHPIGSVPMLPQQDGGAVGPDLVVYGTSNVRVIDSSIIPVQLSAHLSSTVYGIAEKVIDLIKTRDAGGL